MLSPAATHSFNMALEEMQIKFRQKKKIASCDKVWSWLFDKKGLV